MVNSRAALAWEGNARTYRQLSLTPWVRSAIKIRREQISAAEWDIVPYEKEGRQNKRLAQRISDFLDTPNARLISFHAFAQEVIEDLLVLDGAAIEKVRYARRRPRRVVADAGRVHRSGREVGRLRGGPPALLLRP